MCGKCVMGFINSEEVVVELIEVVLFFVEDMLKINGVEFECSVDWVLYVVIDGLLIIG